MWRRNIRYLLKLPLPWQRSRRTMRAFNMGRTSLPVKQILIWSTILLVLLGWRGMLPIPSVWGFVHPSQVLEEAWPLAAAASEKSPLSGWWEKGQILWLGGLGKDSLNRIVEDQVPVLYHPTAVPVGSFTSDTKPGAGNYEETLPEGEDNSDVDIPREDPRASNSTNEVQPVVLVYHTHNAETYAATDKVARIDGKNAGITKVGAALVKRLKDKHKINALQDLTIHDYPSYDLSYNESAKTIDKLLQATPNPYAVLDIHRDATKTRDTVVVNGKRAAKILIVVGTDARAEHPKWRENNRFAQLLVDKMNAMYPGLSLGILTKEGRYHQHFHSRVLLLEVGSDKNSTAEGEYAAELFADALQAVIQDLVKDNGFNSAEPANHAGKTPNENPAKHLPIAPTPANSKNQKPVHL